LGVTPRGVTEDTPPPRARVKAERNIWRRQPIDRVVGHSLGGSVVLQLQRDHDTSRTFGAPVCHLGPGNRVTDLAQGSSLPLPPKILSVSRAGRQT
jgi:hypothetical protein